MPLGINARIMFMIKTNKKFSIKLLIKIYCYPSFLTYVLGTQKNHLIEAALLSTHNIMFRLRNKKIHF